MQAVITTINKPTEAVRKLEQLTDLIVVGDIKTPKDFSGNHVFIAHHDESEFSIIKFLPDNHYSRKNLGYLAAIASGTDCIYDTDDDNTPNKNWREREYNIECIGSLQHGIGWFNVYKLFSNNNVWPRGFSLNHLHNEPSTYYTTYRKSSIQQGLSDGEPDVDAIFRLLHKYKVTFNKQSSVYLTRGHWCPFNSQSTWWFPKAYPLMYLPVTASFRMTDIWRSFIAQRCLWEMGEGVTFHSPSEVFQDRNEHDLLKDFKDEVPGYLNNDLIVQILTDLKLNGDVFENMTACYRALVDEGIMVMHELRSLRCWINDVKQIWKP